MKLKLFTLGLALCLGTLAAPKECARCGHHSSVAKPRTPATAATTRGGEQSSTLISRLLYI